MQSSKPENWAAVLAWFERLHDAGLSPDGLPYFVMERVQGPPIDQACAGLKLEQLLQPFLKLADAVAHVHSRLLVHRDLKPSNVLVNEAGRTALELRPQADPRHIVFRSLLAVEANNLAIALLYAGQAAEALALTREVDALHGALQRDEPDNPNWTQRCLGMSLHLGRALAANGEWRAALPVLQGAVQAMAGAKAGLPLRRRANCCRPCPPTAPSPGSGKPRHAWPRSERMARKNARRVTAPSPHRAAAGGAWRLLGAGPLTRPFGACALGAGVLTAR